MLIASRSIYSQGSGSMQTTIAIIFDFDDTLAPDSTSSFLHHLGINVNNFWKNEVSPLIEEGWDPIPAYLFKILELSKNADSPLITKNKLINWGAHIEFYQGVDSIFERLRNHAKNINPRIKLEFYLISSGIGEILRNTKIAENFKEIWACDFSYNQKGEIMFPKKIVSFTDKTRYIFHISKGIVGKEFIGKPFEVNRKDAPGKQRIPLDRMIFIGDGYTDVPCFSLVRKAGGTPIAVCDQDDQKKWGRAWGFLEDKRVFHWAVADYSEKSTLSASLLMSLESAIRKIELEQQTYQG